MIRNLRELRTRNPRFSIKELMRDAGLSLQQVSELTVIRFLKRAGYFYLQSRKKGLLTSHDLKRRVKFVKRMREQYREDVWTKDIAFYLDGVSLAHKTNPAEAGRAPKGRIWRRRGEGIAFGCTAKGQKEGTGGKLVKLVVAISYNEGVILCQPYEKLNGAYFASLISRKFNTVFDRANKNGSRLWVQDGDPSQNSAAARRAMRECHCENTLIRLAPRSPDINPIENVFHILRNKLRQDAITQDISKETYTKFQERVIHTVQHISVETINKTIASMPKRLTEILKRKGGRIKY